MLDRGNDKVEVEFCMGKYGLMAGDAMSTTELQLTCRGKCVVLCSWFHPSPPATDRRRTPESRIRTGSRSALKQRRAAGAGTQGEHESKFRVVVGAWRRHRARSGQRATLYLSSSACSLWQTPDAFLFLHQSHPVVGAQPFTCGAVR
jgi:hypothetical protein